MEANTSTLNGANYHICKEKMDNLHILIIIYWYMLQQSHLIRLMWNGLLLRTMLVQGLMHAKSWTKLAV